MNDSYVYIIVALLPLAAVMLTLQVNPYHALVTRGILGAVAALVYVVLGAPDVALTEALVGTMLSITLYAVAVRSSLVMRLGVLKDSLLEVDNNLPFAQLITDLRSIVHKHHLRLELISYQDPQALEQALIEKEIHAICIQNDLASIAPKSELQLYQTKTRIRRLYELLQPELSSTVTCLTYFIAPNLEEKH